MFAGLRKPIAGFHKGTAYKETYVPNSDIKKSFIQQEECMVSWLDLMSHRKLLQVYNSNNKELLIRRHYKKTWMAWIILQKYKTE